MPIAIVAVITIDIDIAIAIAIANTNAATGAVGIGVIVAVGATDLLEVEACYFNTNPHPVFSCHSQSVRSNKSCATPFNTIL